ncbi:MAG: DUF5916 domain-containing protein [Terriglobales bacterium]
MSDGRSFPRESGPAKRRTGGSPAPTQSVGCAGRWLGLALAVALLGANTAAQNPPPPAGAPPPRLRALRVSETIKIDGRLDEPAWARAEVATDFRQEEPKEGEPATEKTEIRVLFDDRNLYIGIRAFDSDAEHVQARDLTRDSSLSNDDKVEILLDTYHDRRNAYRFAVNPFGTQQDALITDEGRDTNLSWDAPWTSEGRRDPAGWTAEMAIPLSNLRFREGEDTWGLNFARVIRRKHEESLWTAWKREFGLERVSQAGELVGVGEIKRRRLLEFKPYATGGWQVGLPQVGEAGFNAGVFGTAGLEVARIGITPSLTAEFTVNPDFGQTEVDQQVVNLTRFDVFFPEKREFFLENFGIFLFGREEINQLFFTRRIGLTEEGERVPLDYGAKITGKLGRYNIGFLQVQQRQLGDPAGIGIPRQQFTIARVKRDVFKRSYIGAMVVKRQGGVTHAYNRGAGVDAEFNVTDYWQIKGFLMGTATPGLHSGFLSGRIQSNYETDRYRLIALFESIGTNFNPEMGFAERTGIRQYFAQAAYKPRPKFLRKQVRQMEFETQLEYFEDYRTGKLQTRQAELTWGTLFQNSSRAEVRFLQSTTDVLTQPFEIRPGIVIPPGAYHFNRPFVEFSSDNSKRVVFTLFEQWGSFYSGTRSRSEASVTLRPNSHFSLSLSDSYNRVHLAQGDFSTNLLAGRASYNFSRTLLTNVFVQVNSAAQVTAINARLRYIFRPHSDFYFIYNQSTGKGLERPSRQVQFKITYHYGR